MSEGKTVVYRVQDSDGRGPFKPGFSGSWIDADIGDRDNLRAWPLEFGDGIVNQVRLLVAHGYHCGCACRDIETIKRWFTAAELERLKVLGYSIVKMRVDRILAESKDQLVFAREIPLRKHVIPIA
jgi:hypothetical protein